MPTITPPSAPLPTPSTAVAPPVVFVQTPPAALARLAIGQLLEATVTTQISKDVFQVNTPLGRIDIQAPLALPKGGVLVLQLQSHTPSVLFQINSLDGGPLPHSLKTAPTAALASGLAAHGATKTSAATQTATQPKLAPGNILQATILRPLSQALSQPLSQPGPSNPTAPGLAANKGLSLPQSGAAPGLSKISPSSPSLASSTSRAGDGTTNPLVSKTASPAISKTTAYLPPGSQLSVKITAVQLPNLSATSITTATPASPGASPALIAGTTLNGAVTGSTPSGQPIVQTSAGVFALNTQTVVPRGSVVTLDVINAPSPPLVKPGALPALHDSLFTLRRWPALEQVIEVMHEANPSSAQQLVNSIIPRPDVGLTSGLIFFLAALRGGDLRSLLGEDPMRLIERSRPNLAGRIKEDFASLVRIADDPGSGDWRVALIPINTGAQIEQIRMLMRHGDGEDEESDSVSDTRFVLDVQLTTLGRLQLDGLVRNKGKSLDLIIRTDKPLSDTMHNDIRTIFTEAAELSGLKGGVNFQAAPAGFIDIPDPSSEHALGLVV